MAGIPQHNFTLQKEPPLFVYLFSFLSFYDVTLNQLDLMPYGSCIRQNEIKKMKEITLLTLSMPVIMFSESSIIQFSLFYSVTLFICPSCRSHSVHSIIILVFLYLGSLGKMVIASIPGSFFCETSLVVPL